MSIASLLLALAFVPACATPVPTIWRTQVVFTAPAKLSGCAIGDVDPSAPGNEIVAVGEQGNVFVIARTPPLPLSDHDAMGDDNWKGVEVFRAPGELVQCAIGDVDPDAPGPEIVAAGKEIGAEHDPGGGALYVIRREGAGFAGRRIATFPQLAHGVCIANGAIYMTGYDKTLERVTRDGAAWKHETLVELPGIGKNCMPLGEDFIVACTDGSLVRARKNGMGWVATVIDKRDAARSRLGTDGSRILCSDDDGTLTLFSGDARTVLLSGSHLKQRGAVFADLDPNRPGLEIGTAGYDRCIRVLWQDGDSIRQVLPFVDEERFHHTCAGNLDADLADELVCVGFSGHVVIVKSVAAR